VRVTVNGIDLAVQADGPEDAPVVILHHTLATSRAMWRAQVAHLASRYRVISFDARGHGESAAPDYPYSLEMLAEDVIGVLDGLGIKQPAIFMGISIGGMVGQALGLRHPDRFRALILCSTTSRMAPDAAALFEKRAEMVRRDGVESQVQMTLERWLSPDFRARDPETTKWVGDMIRGTSAPGMIHCFEAIKALDYLDQLSRIATPTLLIAGEKDPGAPVAAMEEMRDRIKGAQLDVVADCLHQTPIEAPDAFNRIVDRFLAGLR
jgi:3-oxoadipate enol-lactonase